MARADRPDPTIAPSNARSASLAFRSSRSIRVRRAASLRRVTGLQLRAARTLAGMTQSDLAAALGVNERAVRFWERKRDRKPTSVPNDERIEQVLTERGVILFADPTRPKLTASQLSHRFPVARAVTRLRITAILPRPLAAATIRTRAPRSVAVSSSRAGCAVASRHHPRG
jgi:DNA-binding transcriptional regulator YiaG